MEDLFDKALEANGAVYLEIELRLRKAIASGMVDAIDGIKRGVAKAGKDPLSGLLANVLLASSGNAEQDYGNVEKLFVNLPARTARTPIGSPPPAGVESMLTRAYGPRLSRFLALRLVKEPDWPRWQALGVLFYLAAHKDPATTSALLRYAIVTPDPERRGWAAKAVGQISDPAQATKLAEALAWAKARKIPVPAGFLDPPPDEGGGDESH